MSDIWSKAPEGAIGFAAEIGGAASIWYKRDQFGNLLYSVYGQPDIWHQSFLVPDHVVWRDFPCVEWKGEGQPPVGTECEAYSVLSEAWYTVKILDYQGSNGAAACRRFDDVLFWSTSFRPIRTPEQLAAERRAETIKRAANLCAFPRADHTFVILEALYDNGLLKGSDDQ